MHQVNIITFYRTILYRFLGSQVVLEATPYLAYISPFRKDRQAARELGNDDNFIEIFVDCAMDVCEQRDPKGSYKKAREGIIKEFTGISAPYEAPENPEIHLHTDKMSVDECVRFIMDYLIKHKYIPG